MGVFISYVREDSAAVDRMAAYLEARGIRVWLDRKSIAPGQRWKIAIRRAIDSGSFFVCCFSANAWSRTSTHMNEEIVLAIEELRRRPHDHVWFIPLRLSRCEIPDRQIGAGETLRDFHAIDLFDDWAAGCAQLVQAIRPGSGVEPQGWSHPPEIQAAAQELRLDVPDPIPAHMNLADRKAFCFRLLTIRHLDELRHQLTPKLSDGAVLFSRNVAAIVRSTENAQPLDQVVDDALVRWIQFLSAPGGDAELAATDVHCPVSCRRCAGGNLICNGGHADAATVARYGECLQPVFDKFLSARERARHIYATHASESSGDPAWPSISLSTMAGGRRFGRESLIRRLNAWTQFRAKERNRVCTVTLELEPSDFEALDLFVIEPLLFYECLTHCYADLLPVPDEMLEFEAFRAGWMLWVTMRLIRGSEPRGVEMVTSAVWYGNEPSATRASSLSGAEAARKLLDWLDKDGEPDPWNLLLKISLDLNLASAARTVRNSLISRIHRAAPDSGIERRTLLDALRSFARNNDIEALDAVICV